ncbi:putative Late embryogenesis abundant protein, LEA-14 [Rosa chinensis]|uniref:Putative Late embryogenesis abundant protein, LEA-14 n=1 Tax=Rosa chinensis TaxID=74649 RepID=A0A2P6Q1G1_ROSCH|nr:NDR1/HIN1-like protein 13 [Rosa chinensis]PRQ27969.1 putative Late embryogenesis abundant protein, LEA-14 [Rosa chinensis]
MTDRVYPSSKVATNGAANGTTATTTAANPTATKPQPLRQPYRPQPQYRHRRNRRSNRSLCCCFCFWSILIFLIVALLAAIAGTALYVLYRPHRPEFTVTALKIGKLNLTDNPDGASSHLVTRFNVTIAPKNPNNHLSFAYDSFALTLSAANNDVVLGNGSIPAFFSDTKNFTSFRSIITTASDLDLESVKSLRSDLKRKGGVPMKLRMDTKVKVTVGGKLKSNKVGIRVTCQQIRGVAPKGKSPSVASVADSHCKVDLRIKIWRWTF